MRFIGQAFIMSQLRILLPTLVKYPDRGAGILYSGPSGCGKTTMALASARYLVGDDLSRDFRFYLGTAKEFLFDKRVTLIDEVHKVKEPEILYPILDSKEKILLLTTNFHGELPEALVNRCNLLMFDKYSLEELTLMVLEKAEFKAPDSSLAEIVLAGNSNPRIIGQITENLNMYFNLHPDINSAAMDFKSLIGEVFGIVNGLDSQCRRYIEVLEDVGGKASLHLLKSVLHLDSMAITEQIEPVLLKKGLIRITSKGRSLNR